MTEQFILKEMLRQRRTIDRDKGFRAAWAPTVNGAGYDFFPRTGFTEQKDGTSDDAACLAIVSCAVILALDPIR